MVFNIVKATPSELEALDEAITDYNITKASELPKAEIFRLDFVAKSEEHELMGGIQAKRINWGILHIELLYVFEHYRSQGIATALLQHVEKIAKENQCHIAHLSTFDFQAKDFYLKHGYSVFGTLENSPKRHCRYYMKKDLSLKNKDVIIRQMRGDDVDILVSNFCFPWSSKETTQEIWQRYYREQQESLRTVGIVEKEERLLGYASLLRRSKYPNYVNIPEISALWIDENYRRSGLATQLITYLEDLARNEGYDKVGIGVGLYKDYGPAQRLYFRLGYKPDGYGIAYQCQPVIPGEKYPVDDDLILWLVKTL